jgi:hypothetical protein
LHNKLFDDDVRVERIVPVNTGAAGPRYSIVTSQPAIRGVAASEKETDAMMDGKGFEKLASHRPPLRSLAGANKDRRWLRHGLAGR